MTKAHPATPFVMSALILALAWTLGHVGLPYATAMWPLAQLLLASYCGLVALLCIGYHASCVRENSPANAMLVPGLRRRLMGRAALAWGLSTLSIAAGVAIVLGVHRMAGAAILAGAVPGAWLIARRVQPKVSLVLLVVAILTAKWTSLDHHLVVLGAILGQPSWFAVGLLLDLALLAAGLWLALPRAGDRHIAWHQRLRAVVPMWQGNFAASEMGSRTSLPGLGYARVLARDSRRSAGRRSAGPGKMMMHALSMSYPVLPMVMGAVQAIMAIATLPAVAGTVEALSRFGTLRGSQMFQALIVTAAPMYAVGVWGTLSSLRGEQALYRLAPAAPAGGQFNRVLAAELLSRYMQVWLVSVLCLGLVAWVAGDLARTAGMLVLQALLALPFAGLLLRDYAAMPAAKNNLAPLLTIGFVTGFYIFSFAYIRALPTLDWGTPALVLTAAIALVLRQQWQAMVRAAPAFPACRQSCVIATLPH